MTLKIKILYNTVWYDVSNYIVSCGEIPIISTNEDHSISAEGFSFDIRDNFTVRPFAEIVAEFNEVKFFVNDVAYFHGVVNQVTENIKEHTYTFECSNVLSKLNDYKVDYQTLHDTLVANSSGDIDYKEVDIWGSPNVQLLYLMEQIFGIAFNGTSVSVDLSNLVGLEVIHEKLVYNLVLLIWQARNFTLSDIRIDENILYAINQNYAIDHTTIDTKTVDSSNSSYQNNKITFWEFIEQICLMFSLFIQYEDGVYVVRRITTNDNYTISSDNVYDKKNKVIEKKENNYKLIINTLLTVQSYRDSVKDVLIPYYTGSDYETVEETANADQNIYWMNNFILTLQNADYPIGDTHYLNVLAILEYDKLNFVTPNDTDILGFGIYKRVIDSIINPLTTLEIETDITTGVKQVFSNMVNVENRISTIKSGGYS